MTEPNTQREETQSINYQPKNLALWKAVKQLGNLKRDGSDEIDPITVMKMVDTELTKAREEGRNQEKTEVSEACKRLAGLADFNHVSDEMRSSATLYLLRSAEEDKSKYIKFLQEQPEQAIQSYRQELRTKVEQRIEALKTKELRGDGILVLEDLLTIISE